MFSIGITYLEYVLEVNDNATLGWMKTNADYGRYLLLLAYEVQYFVSLFTLEQKHK